jgi:hypothetical protein
LRRVKGRLDRIMILGWIVHSHLVRPKMSVFLRAPLYSIE